MSVQADRRDAQRSRQEWSSRLLSLEQQLHESEHGERRAREEARQARQEAEAARRAVAAITDLEVRMIPLAKHRHAHPGWSSTELLVARPFVRRQAASESVACGGCPQVLVSSAHHPSSGSASNGDVVSRVAVLLQERELLSQRVASLEARLVQADEQTDGLHRRSDRPPAPLCSSELTVSFMGRLLW